MVNEHYSVGCQVVDLVCIWVPLDSLTRDAINMIPNCRMMSRSSTLFCW